MKYSKLTLMLIGLMFSCFSIVEAAKAEGSRSYISPSGLDNRPCSRNQPCRTFDGALAKTDANGEIIALETGTYDPTTVTKSVTLTAAPGADVVIRATSGNAVTINIGPATTVVLRGLKLSGPGKDSNVKGVMIGEDSGGMIFIENCVISNFGTGIHAIDNVVELGISDSVFRNNQTGMFMKFNGTDAKGAVATRTRFEGNGTGAQTSGSKAFVVNECVAAGNGIGFLADPNGTLVISNSVAARNTSGIEARGSSSLYIGSSNISGNITGISSDSVIRSRGDNIVTANDIDLSVLGILNLAGI